MAEKEQVYKNRNESKLYFPLCQTLKELFDTRYVENSYTIDRKTKYQRAPVYGIQNPRLEITANGEVSDLLQSKFSYFLFENLQSERLHPDLMGFVKRKKKSKPEFITVEIKKIL